MCLSTPGIGLLLILLSTMYLIKTFRTYVAVSYERTEHRQVIVSKTPSIRIVSHEISTQTDAEHGRLNSVTDKSDDGGAVGPSPN